MIEMLLIDGKIHETQELPTILFGRTKALSYVLNPKAACTLALNFLFFVNHNYRYFHFAEIHRANRALFRLHGPDLDPNALAEYFRRSPESFTIVRDPVRRFISGFLSKIFSDDPEYLSSRDALTSLYGIDLSPEANPAQSCLTFAKWIAAQDQKQLDPHFRPQYLNLMVGGRFSVDTILHLEDRDAILAFFTRWIGAEKAKWFLSLRFSGQNRCTSDEVITDELKELIGQIYARDYELFYSGSRYSAAVLAPVQRSVALSSS
jgi:Sulfotransferase family